MEYSPVGWIAVAEGIVPGGESESKQASVLEYPPKFIEPFVNLKPEVLHNIQGDNLFELPILPGPRELLEVVGDVDPVSMAYLVVMEIAGGWAFAAAQLELCHPITSSNVAMRGHV